MVFSGFLYALWKIIRELLRYFFPVFIGIALFAILRMIYRQKKYGYDYFDVFRKREEIDAKKAGLIDMIQKIDPNVSFLNGTYQSDIVAFTSIGIILVSTFPKEQTEVKGNVTDKSLTCRMLNGTINEVANPFYKQAQDIESLKKLLPEIPIFGYVVFDSASVFSFRGKCSSKEIRFSQFYYEFNHEMKEHKKYSKEEIESFKAKLV